MNVEVLGAWLQGFLRVDGRHWIFEPRTFWLLVEQPCPLETFLLVREEEWLINHQDHYFEAVCTLSAGELLSPGGRRDHSAEGVWVMPGSVDWYISVTPF